MIRSERSLRGLTLGRAMIVIGCSAMLALAMTMTSGAADPGGPDADSDGVPDALDNCINVANGAQSDGDSDGFGDACDFDTNNDCAVTNADVTAIQPLLGSSEPPDSPYDVNTDGAITLSDVTLVMSKRGDFVAESGLACAECDGSPTGAGAAGPCQ